MLRMFIWAWFAWAGGFITFFVIFTSTAPPDRGLSFTFSAMGAVPVAAVVTLFVGVGVLQEECRALRREIDRLRVLIPTKEPSSEKSNEGSSTSFRE